MTAETATVLVRAIAAGGDGVATLADGRAVFIPRAAPGDQLRLRNLRRYSRFARAEVESVVVPGTGRVTPPCPHYTADNCGSCQLMHLSASVQRAAKGQIAGDALRRIAGLDVVDPPVIAPRDDFGYRNKVTFTIAGGCIGYHPINDPVRVFDVRACLLASPPIRSLHDGLRASRVHLPRDGARLVLRVDRAGSLHVIVRTGAKEHWRRGGSLHAALHEAGVNAVVWHQPDGAGARVVAGTGSAWRATVFEQVHPAMGDLVRAAALDALAPTPGAIVWDLYAGAGETTSGLAARGAEVDSVEADSDAVQLAERGGPVGPHRHAGLVEGRVASLRRPSAVVTNPPRTGMSARVTTALVESKAARIAYISCDPATLARDIARLEGAYRVARVTVFDQFPQTAHMECLAVLDRK